MLTTPALLSLPVLATVLVVARRLVADVLDVLAAVSAANAAGSP